MKKVVNTARSPRITVQKPASPGIRLSARTVPVAIKVSLSSFIFVLREGETFSELEQILPSKTKAA